MKLRYLAVLGLAVLGGCAFYTDRIDDQSLTIQKQRKSVISEEEMYENADLRRRIENAERHRRTRRVRFEYPTDDARYKNKVDGKTSSEKQTLKAELVKTEQVERKTKRKQAFKEAPAKPVLKNKKAGKETGRDCRCGKGEKCNCKDCDCKDCGCKSKCRKCNRQTEAKTEEVAFEEVRIEKVTPDVKEEAFIEEKTEAVVEEKTDDKKAETKEDKKEDTKENAEEATAGCWCKFNTECTMSCKAK